MPPPNKNKRFFFQPTKTTCLFASPNPRKVQNILNTALYNGAAVEFCGFDAAFCLKREPQRKKKLRCSKAAGVSFGFLGAASFSELAPGLFLAFKQKEGTPRPFWWSDSYNKTPTSPKRQGILHRLTRTPRKPEHVSFWGLFCMLRFVGNRRPRSR